jgi:FkbM family methyltransferase
MNLNRAKRYLRKSLPSPVFNGIQWMRKLAYRRPHEIEVLRRQFEQLNGNVVPSGSIALRHGIVLRIDDESRYPFEWFCWRSPEMVRELDLFIKRINGTAVFADIGANHGIFSLVFAAVNPHGTAISVDPSPIASQILRKNLELNGLNDRVRHHQIACGASHGTVLMHYNWHHLEASQEGGQSSNDVQIEVETLDEICAKEGVKPAVVKIDVEGFELDVLRGADKTLSHANLLFLEIHPERLDELGVSQPAIFEWLDSRNWTIKSLVGKRLSAAEFNDRIHTFWTLCERENGP